MQYAGVGGYTCLVRSKGPVVKLKGDKSDGIDKKSFH